MNTICYGPSTTKRTRLSDSQLRNNLRVRQAAGDLCYVSSSATSEAIHTVTEIAGKLGEHINMPSTRVETEATMQWFKRTGGFPNPRGERGEVYRNRHGVFSINVQVMETALQMPNS
uniref:Uncharacterized protein n=1 Tax=Timema cristinae TaxID=61476 RepID=A0A7R9H4P3_TIMCR|nr:unnamed protein product [Timema cristinae]